MQHLKQLRYLYLTSVFLRQQEQHCGRQRPNTRAVSTMEWFHTRLCHSHFNSKIIALLGLISWCWWLENIFASITWIWKIQRLKRQSRRRNVPGQELVLAGAMPMGSRGYQDLVLVQSRRAVRGNMRLHRTETAKLPWAALQNWLFFLFLHSDFITPSHRPRYMHWKLHASIISIYYINPQWCFNSPFHCTSISKILAWLPLPLPQWQL